MVNTATANGRGGSSSATRTLRKAPIRGHSLLALVILLLGLMGCSSNGTALRLQKDTYTYKTVGDHRIQADVYRQADDDETRPAIIWIHSGALVVGSRDWIASEQMEAYLEAGYAVISIDHRLAPETRLAAIVEDLEDAYAWVRSEGPELLRIDPHRIAVVGHSAGGYLALLAGARLQPRPRALVSFYGYG